MKRLILTAFLLLVCLCSFAQFCEATDFVYKVGAAYGTTASLINSTDGSGVTFTVDSGVNSNAFSASNFYVLLYDALCSNAETCIDKEIILISARTSNTFTISSRAQGGSLASAWLISSNIQEVDVSGAGGAGLSGTSCSASNWFSVISGNVISCTQPAFSDISGSLGHSQLPTLLSGDIPSNAADTTGTAAGLSAQYIDWSASSGGTSIANKPTLGTISTQSASSVAITGGTLAGLTGLAIRDTSAAFDVTFAATSSVTLTAGKTLIFDVGNVANTLKFPTGQTNVITTPAGTKTLMASDYSNASYTAAHAGANSDITSLAGLTTPLTVGQGGTGITDLSFTSTQHKVPSVSGTPADGCGVWASGVLGSTGTSCGSSGGMTYPSGSGFAIVSGGTSWGTTLADPLGAVHGGTGVANNVANTITFSGNYGLTLTLTNTTALTFPVSGTLCSTGSVCNGYQAALTNPVTGTGTQYYLPVWTGAGTIGALASLGTTGYVLTSNGAGAAPTWQVSASGFSNPMTTLGDIIFENASPVADRLAGNITTTKKFLTQTGTGSVSAAPTWSTLVSGDIPSNAANTTGTAANLSGTQTANYFYAAPNGSSGSGLWRAIVAADIPTLNQNTSGSAGSLSGTQTQHYAYMAPSGSSGSATFRAIVASDLPATITSNTSGNAATVTTNANLTGDVTSVGNATTVAKIGGVLVSADPLSQYVLKTGRTGGQTVYGGLAASDNLNLYSTSNATKGYINLYDKVGFHDNANFIESYGLWWIDSGGNGRVVLTVDTSNNVLIGNASLSGQVYIVGSNLGLDNAHPIYFKNATGTYKNMMFLSSSNDLEIGHDLASGHLLMNIDGTSKLITLGAADSCGTGYKCLRVPN